MTFLNLIRWKNLVMIAMVQLLLKYAFLESFGAQTSLNTLGITLLILATVCIAAAGNIINDICDVETDFINKPDKLIIGNTISEKTAYNLFIILNVLGVGIGFYLSHWVGKSAFFSIFVIISVLLYVYATYLKQTFLIGNIVISLLVALSILIVGVFELLPSITSLNRQVQLTYFEVIFNYAVFAFIVNLLREIVKDLEDIEGDVKTNMNTLPIVLGKKTTHIVLILLSFFTIILVVNHVMSSLYKYNIAVLYFLALVVGPLIYASIKIIMAQQKKDYIHISYVLKLVMLFGMFSLFLYAFIFAK